MVQDRAHEMAERAQARQQPADEQDVQDQQTEPQRQGSEPLTEDESRRLADGIDRAYRRGR